MTTSRPDTRPAALPSADAPASYRSDPRDEAALLAECIGHMLAGTPLPERVRPGAPGARRPATTEEGIAQILAGSPATEAR
jgi:hypothetical protein